MKPLQELLSLDGKTAIVTGGAVGIGFGITHRLAEAGASVLIADIDENAGAQAAKELVSHGFEVSSVLADVADESSVRNTLDVAIKQYGSIDILVNNAGIYPNLPLAQLEPVTFDRIVSVNLRGVFLFTKYVSEQMKLQGTGGRIINVTSIDALHPSMIGLATYDATKHGVWGFSKNVAVELARYGIQVNAVAPGGINTPGTKPTGPSEPGVDLEALTAAFLSKIPMGRMGEPDDIGKVVLFLASDMASYMTGSQVVVDGGALLT